MPQSTLRDATRLCCGDWHNSGILDEAFLTELRVLPQKNLALEMLRK